MSTTNTHLSGAIELFGKSYEVIKRNIRLFALLYAIPAIFSVIDFIDRYNADDKSDFKASEVIKYGFFGGNWNVPDQVQSLLLVLLLLIVSVIVSVMLMILMLRAAQGQKPTFSDIWLEFRQKWLWLRLIALQVFMTILIVVGLLLLIIPGVILMWRFFLAPYILIDKDKPIAEALHESWRMTKGHAWAIYSVIIVLLVLGLTGIVPLVGGLIAAVLTAIYSVAPALRYEEIKKLPQAPSK